MILSNKYLIQLSSFLMRSFNCQLLTDINRSFLITKQDLVYFVLLEQRDRPQDIIDDPLGEMEMANVIARKQQQRTGNKTNSNTAYSSNEVNIHFYCLSYLLLSSCLFFVY